MRRTDLGGQREHVAAVEGRPQRAHLIQQTAERPDVRLLTVRQTLHNLRTAHHNIHRWTRSRRPQQRRRVGMRESLHFVTARAQLHICVEHHPTFVNLASLSSQFSTASTPHFVWAGLQITVRVTDTTEHAHLHQEGRQCKRTRYDI